MVLFFLCELFYKNTLMLHLPVCPLVSSLLLELDGHSDNVCDVYEQALLEVSSPEGTGAVWKG